MSHTPISWLINCKLALIGMQHSYLWIIFPYSLQFHYFWTDIFFYIQSYFTLFPFFLQIVPAWAHMEGVLIKKAQENLTNLLEIFSLQWSRQWYSAAKLQLIKWTLGTRQFWESELLCCFFPYLLKFKINTIHSFSKVDCKAQFVHISKVSWIHYKERATELHF